MSHNADCVPPLTKRPDETQTAFAIRCVQAQAWMEGWKAMGGDTEFGLRANPYLDLTCPTTPTECGDYPAPCNHDPAHVTPLEGG